MGPLNQYTLDLIVKYLNTKFAEVPKLEYSIPSEHFHNYALDYGIQKIGFMLKDANREGRLFSQKRADRATIETVVKEFEKEAQMFFNETDTTCYTWEYSSAMSKVAEYVKSFFIRRPQTS